MARVIDISNKLSNEKPLIKLSDEVTVELNDSMKNVLTVMKDLDEDMSEVEMINNLSVKLFGKEGKKKIDTMNLSVSSYFTLIKSAMALLLDQDVEVVDNMFRKEIEQA